MNRIHCLTATMLLLCGTNQAAETIVKRYNGVCYESSSRTYKDIISYKPYGSVEACLKSGGRLPNTKGWAGLIERDVSGNANKAEHSEASSTHPATPPTPDKKLFDTADGALVKRTRDGVCLAADHPQYAKIEQYAAYRTMQDCLSAE